MKSCKPHTHRLNRTRPGLTRPGRKFLQPTFARVDTGTLVSMRSRLQIFLPSIVFLFIYVFIFFYAITCYHVFINAPEGCHVVLITLIACKDMAHEWVAMVHVYQQCGQGPVLARYTPRRAVRGRMVHVEGGVDTTNDQKGY